MPWVAPLTASHGKHAQHTVGSESGLAWLGVLAGEERGPDRAAPAKSGLHDSTEGFSRTMRTRGPAARLPGPCTVLPWTELWPPTFTGWGPDSQHLECDCIWRHGL